MEPLGPLSFLGSAQPAFLFFFHLVQVGVLLVLLRYLDLYEREPFPTILAMFVWGAAGATLVSVFGNAFVSSLLPPDINAVYGPAISAPLVEEASKGLALLAVILVSVWMARRYGTHGFSGVSDGIVYGAAVGLGFAFVENIIFFFNFALISGNLQGGTEVFLSRVDFSGLGVLGHALYTGMFGAGLGLAAYTTSQWRKLLYAGGGLALAMLLHAKWNGLAVFLVVREFGFDLVAAAQTTGVSEAQLLAVEAAFEAAHGITIALYYLALIGAAVGFALWLRHERAIIRFELAEEVNTGLLTREEYDLLPRFWRRTGWYVDLLRAGEFHRYAALRDLHNLLVRMALIKWRVRRTGADPTPVYRLRGEINALRTYALTLAQLPHGASETSPPQPASVPVTGAGG